MASRSYVKPINKSNIRTTTIYTEGGRSQNVSRPATQEEKDAVTNKARESFARSQAESNLRPKESDFVIKPQTDTLEVNQTSQQGETPSRSSSYNPNRQFEARLVAQVPPNVVADGGVNQGSEFISYLPRERERKRVDVSSFSTLTPTPETYEPSFDNFLPQSEIVLTDNGLETKYNFDKTTNFRIDKVSDYYAKLYSDKEFARTSKGESAFVEGAISFVAGGVAGITKPIFNPIDTSKGIVESLENPQKAGAEFGQQLEQQPSRTIGEIFGTTKGVNLLFKGATKTSDRFRTMGREEIARIKVTDPKVISGERQFPYKPQTQSQLAKEFYGRSEYVANVRKLYGDESDPFIFQKPKISGVESTASYTEALGEALLKNPKNKPLGFSASDSPLKSEIVLTRKELGDFSSKSDGLYQAPSLSEHFLKIKSTDSQRYSILPNFVSRPTINIVKSTNIRTFPDKVVKQARSSPNPVEYLNKYAEQNFKKGESFITPEYALGKKESEALLKAGTEFQTFETRSGQRYFVNVEGRRVPITAIEPTNIFGRTTPPTSNIKTTEAIRKDFLETSRSVQSPSGNPNLFEDFLKASQSGQSTSIRETNDITSFQPLRFTPLEEQAPSQIETITYEPIFEPESRGGGFNPVVSITKIESSSDPDPTPPKRTRKPSNIFIPPSSRTTPSSSSPIISPPSSRTTPSKTSSIREIPRIISFTPISTIKPRSSRTQAFDVLIRRGGKFFKENPQPLTKQSAINFGTFKVQSDSSATFKLKSVFGKPSTFLRSGNISDFYRKGNLFIEKKEKRIKRSSPLELQQITFKGIATNRAKSKKIKNIFGGL